MVRLRYILVMALMATASTPVFAEWKIVIDKSCIKVVAANTASQELIEDRHNQRLDSIASKKQEVEPYSMSMAIIKELCKLTTGNISSFGTESLYYKEIGTCAFNILKDVPELINTVNKAKSKNKFACLTELGSLVMEARQLVGNFVGIVSNAKVQSPLRGQNTVEKKSDGYNLLDRYERLSLANRIYIDLVEIRYKVEGMMLMTQLAIANGLFFVIDSESWANVITTKNQVDGLIQDWDGLVATNY